MFTNFIFSLDMTIVFTGRSVRIKYHLLLIVACLKYKEGQYKQILSHFL